MNIPSISPVPQITPADPGRIGSAAGAPGAFQSVLEGMVGRVEQSHAQAQHMVESFVGGGPQELHAVALATQRAELEFDLFLQVRNKVISAYQEIMRMQV